MRLIPHVDAFKAQDTSLAFASKKHLGELLEQIYSGACKCTVHWVSSGRELTIINSLAPLRRPRPTDAGVPYEEHILCSNVSFFKVFRKIGR